MPKSSVRAQRPLRILLLFGGGGLFGYLIWRAGPGELWRQLVKLGWGFALVIVVAGASHLAKTWAWRMTLGNERNKTSFMHLLRLRLGAEAAGQLGVLGQTFGDSVRVSQLGSQIHMANRLASVTLDRGLFLTSGIIVTIAGVLAALSALSLPHAARLYAGTFLFGSTALLTITLFALRRRWPFISSTARLMSRVPAFDKWVNRELALIQSIEKALFDFHHDHPKEFWTSFSLNVLCQCLAVIEVCLILALLGTNTSFLRALIIEGWTKLLNAVGSWNPGNVGTYEGGHILISKMLNLNSGTGLALALARRMRALVWTAVGAVSLLLFTMRREHGDDSGTHQLDCGGPVSGPKGSPGESVSFAIMLTSESAHAKPFWGAVARVGTLPIVLRTILAAQKTGATRIVVLADRETRKLVQRILECSGRAPSVVEWVDVAEDGSLSETLRDIAVQSSSQHWVLVDGNTTYHPSLMRVVGGWRDNDRALALRSAGQSVGIIALSRETLASVGNKERLKNVADVYVSLSALNSVVSQNVEEELWQTVRSREDRLAAEKKLNRWLIKPTDGMYARLNRRISIPISRQLIKLPVTANMVSIFTLGVGFISAMFFALGGYGSTLGGALLCLFASILDGCDGEVARLKLLESDFGCWLETVCDYVFYFFLLIGMAIGQWKSSGSKLYLVWGGLLLFGALTSFLAVGWQRRRLAAGRPEQLLGIWHSHADSQPSNCLLYLARHMEFIVRRCFFPYALVVFALFGIMNVAFVLSVAGANLVWAIALYSSRAFASGRSAPLRDAPATV